MPILQLEIELISGLAMGSGWGSPGAVDRDVTHDEFGLPFLPGKRLKGLLRDAYRAVIDTTAFANLPGADDLFGKAGASHPGSVDFGDAHLPDASEIRNWLKSKPPQMRPDAVLDYFTHRVRQTAMDCTTGSPLKNTLRSTRLINGGLIFHMPIVARSEEQVRPLELAAKALQEAGIARTRGWGEISCTLRNADPIPATGGELATEVENVLRYQLSLERPVLAPSRTGDPNTVRSEDYLSGSMILGLFAQGLSGEQIQELLLAEGVYFLPAYPMTEAGEVLTIVAHSIREYKREEGYFVDLASLEPIGKEPLRRVRGWRNEGDLHEVRRVLHHHHSRASDRRIGRAVGEQYQDFGLKARSEAGELFSYEAIAAGQRFSGDIHGPPEKLAAIKGLIADGTTGLTIGRSRNAQYGGQATWNWLAMNKEQFKTRNSPSKTVIVTLASDLIGVNESLHPSALFPTAMLAKELGEGVALTPIRSFVRSAWCGGYLSHQRLARQQTPCLRAGSVFVFEANIDLTEEKLREAEIPSYGLRTNEGFGRLRLAAESEFELELVRTNQGHSVNLVGPDHPAYKLAYAIFRKQVEAAARARGQYDANRKLTFEAPLTNSLFQRLVGIFRSAEADEIVEQLERLRKPARTQLGRVWFTLENENPGSEINLYDYLQSLCSNTSNNKHAASIESSVYANASSRWNLVFRRPPAQSGEHLVKLYVLSLLRTLLLAQRKRRSPVKEASTNAE